jgi:hypothetical protein
MAAALATAGADVEYAVYPGGHDWNLWTSRVDQMLIMASRYFATAATTEGSPGARAHAAARGLRRLSEMHDGSRGLNGPRALIDVRGQPSLARVVVRSGSRMASLQLDSPGSWPPRHRGGESRGLGVQLAQRALAA